MNVGPGELEQLGFEVIGDHLHPRARTGANQFQALANATILDSHEYGRVASPEKSAGALDSGDPKTCTRYVPQEWIRIVGLYDRHNKFHWTPAVFVGDKLDRVERSSLRAFT
jgi:hypothetical protein